MFKLLTASLVLLTLALGCATSSIPGDREPHEGFWEVRHPSPLPWEKTRESQDGWRTLWDMDHDGRPEMAHRRQLEPALGEWVFDFDSDGTVDHRVIREFNIDPSE